MFRKELIILVCVACVVFGVVAGIATLAVGVVQRDADRVARDTLPGLVNAGQAIERLHENWFNTLRLSGIESAADRAQIIASIEANSTEKLWQRYRDSIYDSRDSMLFESMIASRVNFLKARSKYFELVLAGRMDEAQKLFESSLATSAKEYQRGSRDIFAFNAGEGQERADRIIRLSRWTPGVVGFLCVGALLVGFFLGFKASMGAFSSAAHYNGLRK